VLLDDDAATMIVARTDAVTMIVALAPMTVGAVTMIVALAFLLVVVIPVDLRDFRKDLVSNSLDVAQSSSLTRIPLVVMVKS